MRFIDKFLLPERFYRKLNNRKLTLYLGIAFVGFRDVGLYIWGSKAGNPMSFISSHWFILIVFSLIIGFMDVVFFSFPMFDLFKFLKMKQNDGADIVMNITPIKIMKTYIFANLIVTPLDIILNYTLGKGSSISGISIIIYLFSYIWYMGIITRGISSIFNFKERYIGIVLIVTLLYCEFLNYIFNFIYEKVMIYLL